MFHFVIINHHLQIKSKEKSGRGQVDDSKELRQRDGQSAKVQGNRLALKS